MHEEPLLAAAIDLPLLHRGKVRDIYDLGDRILLVATDRLSAFDVVFDQGIPNKGRILTRISEFWASHLPGGAPYHLVTSDVGEMGEVVQQRAGQLQGRTMLAEKLEMAPVECVVRGYLVGSGWKDYCATGSVCGHALSPGMALGDPLETPLFTPSTKAALGDHDENITFDQTTEVLGETLAQELHDRSLALFQEGAAQARDKGLVLVDTKFEFGRRSDGTLVLADEVLTPDSSRYWDLEVAQSTPRGQTPPSFDKQIIRDYLETQPWDKRPPAPTLPDRIIQQAAQRYQELCERIAGPLAVK